MSEVKISKPILRVVLESDDGELHELTVQTDNRDAVRFDVMRAQRNWPGGDVGPMLWMTVQAWSAIKRSKVEPWASMKIDQFLEVCVDIVAVDAEGQALTDPSQIAGMVTARPTDAVSDSD